MQNIRPDGNETEISTLQNDISSKSSCDAVFENSKLHPKSRA